MLSVRGNFILLALSIFYSIDRYLLGTYYVPGTVQNVRDMVVSKSDRVPAP